MEWDPRWKTVTCRKCGRTFQCLPSDDYYNSTGPNDGECEPCLLGYDGKDDPRIMTDVLKYQGRMN